MSDDSDHCSACLQANRACELAPPYAEMARLDKVEDKLIAELSAAHRAAQEVDARLVRLRKQRRLVQKKRRELGARELQNIEDLETDEVLPEAVLEPFVDPLSPSSFQVSQGSPNRTPASPLRSG